jgi:hypothetical protein
MGVSLSMATYERLLGDRSAPIVRTTVAKVGLSVGAVSASETLGGGAP